MSPRVRRLSAVSAHALWAARYDRDPNPVLALEERIVLPLLPDVRSTPVLDVACGTGRWLARLAARGAGAAVGFDLSEAMLVRAAAKPPLSGRVARCDAACLPLRNAAAGFAICSFGASYMARLEGFAREMARVLGDGARLILTDLHPVAERRGWRRSFRYRGAVIEADTCPRTVPRVCRDFEGAGFEIESLLEPSFGEPEADLFGRAGKSAQFVKARAQAAIYVCRFRRRDP